MYVVPHQAFKKRSKETKKDERKFLRSHHRDEDQAREEVMNNLIGWKIYYNQVYKLINIYFPTPGEPSHE